MASTAKHAFPRLKKVWSRGALAGLAAAASLAMVMTGVMTTNVPAFADQPADLICPSNTDGYGPKIDTTGDPATVSVTADAGMLIDSYCVKAGPGYEIIPVYPPAASVVIDHPTKDSVSHYSLHQIPIPVVDVCANIDGNQATVPVGYVQNGVNCDPIPVPPVDVCANLPGNQETIPAGYVKDGDDCVLTPVPPVDVCDNLPGNQETIPDGHVKDGDNCVLPPPVIPKDATASVHVTPATCDTTGTAEFNITNATWDGPAVLEDGVYTRTATANADHQFSDGTTKAKVTYQLEDILNPNAPPCYTPPTIEPCVTATDGGVSTNLDRNGWTFNETRATGHNEYIDGGLHVWTESNGSTDKAAGYKSLVIPFDQIGTPEINFESYTGVRPSVQIGFDKDGNGTWDGYLVYEPWAYGEGNWWSSKDFGVGSGMGYASFGTLNDYLQANPDAKTVNFGYSLGSGVKGDAVITSITMGCAVYTFDYRNTVIGEFEEPAAVDVCGTDNDKLNVPADTDEVKYTTAWNENHTEATVNAVAQEGYEFPENTTTQWVFTFTDVPCPPTIIEEQILPPTFDDFCGTDNDKTNVPDDGEHYYYMVVSEVIDGEDVFTIYAVPNEGYAFPQGTIVQWSHTFSNELCPVEVTPVTPKFTQPTCDTQYKLDVPKQPAGVVTDVKATTVTFSPAEGYFFPEGTKTVYKYTAITPAGCDSDVPPAGTSVDEAGVSPADSGLGVMGIALLAAGLFFGAFAPKRKRRAIQ